MADEGVVSDIFTKFFLHTCRLHPQLSKHTVQAAGCCARIATQHPDDDTESDYIPLLTGSVAEFYVEPMLPHVGDIDVMFHISTQLAIPEGHPPPTRLPAEFSNCVKVFEIVDSHLPGYVYLELRYLLSQCTGDKYNCFEYDRGIYYTNVTVDEYRKSYVHGPALTNIGHKPLLSVDAVHCIRCLSWPPQAAHWPTRHRNYGWPDSATVDRVVSNGCDVVRVAHRQCRQTEWMSKGQCRLSFSRAEIVLINSWIPVQQIVYHMLRFFMKTKQLIDSADNSERVVVSNYHIKTLMLWTSELKPISWWTESLNLVRICVELLHTLSVCLTDTCCPHYFISNCNLVDISLLSIGMVASELMSIDEAHLSTWFVQKYIGECAQLCPDYVLRLFDDANSITKLHNAVSAIIDFRVNTALLDICTCLDVHLAKLSLSWFTASCDLTAQSYVCLMNESTKCRGGFYLHEYVSAFTLLHVAHKISRNGFNDSLLHVLATIFGQFSDKPRYLEQRCSALYLNKAAKLMKVVANKLVSSVQLMEIELSKAYMYRALRCEESDSNLIYCLANIYLAVLYYTTGQYQTAIDHCTLVMRSQDHSQCSSHVLQGDLLPKIDNDVDSILGLTVFYQYVLSATLNQRQQRQYVSVFTTEIFAYYLHCRILSVTQCRLVTEMSLSVVRQRCAECISEMHQLFIGDVLVFKRLRGVLDQNVCDKPEWSKCGRSAVGKTELDTSVLVELLQQSAVEHLTAFRQLMARDFGSVVTIVTTDFEALYAYKRGDYQRCLQLSTQNVRTLLYADDMPDVATLPEFLQLMDDDIVSLTALTLIVNPECRDHIYNVFITQLTLSLYLITQCQLKLRHSVTSLAQTLDYIEAARRRHPAYRSLDQLALQLIARKTDLSAEPF